MTVQQFPVMNMAKQAAAGKHDTNLCAEAEQNSYNLILKNWLILSFNIF